MIRVLPFFIAALICLSLSVDAQDDGMFHFKGICVKHHVKLENAIIEAFVGKKSIASTKSDAKGNFKLELDYGDDYILTFKYPYCADMQALVYTADMPKEKRNIDATYEITIPFYEKDIETVDVEKFKEPFTRILFDGKSKFIDDANYLKKFTESLVIIDDGEEKDNNSIFTKVYLNPYPADKLISLDGRLKSGNNYLVGYTVILKDSTGKAVKTTVTNKHGAFAFQKIRADNFDIMEVHHDDDATLNASKKITLTTYSKEDVLTADKNADGNYSYPLTGPNRNEIIKKLRDESFSLKIAGKIVYNDSVGANVLSRKKISLVTEAGKILESTQTNLFGGFVFNKAPYEESFLIQIDEKDLQGIDKSKIEIYNYSGKHLGFLFKTANGMYEFKHLKSDQNGINDLIVEDEQLKIDMKGKIYGDNVENPISNKAIQIIDEYQKVISSVNTDNSGSFRLKNIPFNKRFQLHFKDSTLFENFSKIFVTDDKGKIIKTFYITNGRAYDFKILPNDQNKMGFVYVDDPWFTLADNITKARDKNVLIIENIYFGFNSSELLPEAKLALEKAVVLMKAYPLVTLDLTAHTDSKGSPEINLQLSEKRAQSALSYLSARGIDKSRVTGAGLGESKLLNKCADNIECSEEEHAKNRRIEFSFKMK